MSDFNLVKKGYNFRISEDTPCDKGVERLISPEECRPTAANDVTRFLASAPKGKPKAPPLIHEKVKAEFVGVNNGRTDVSTETQTSSSQIPLKKSKSLSVEFKNELGSRHYRTTHKNAASTGSRSARSRDSDNSKAPSSGRSVERVKVSKGIEMKRVVQDAGNVKSRLVKTTTPRNTSNSKSGTKLETESTSKVLASSSSRKMTKTSAECPDVKVKSFLPEHRASGSKSNTAVQSKVPVPNNSVSDLQKEAEKVKIEDDINANAGATLDEFLKMPETKLPEPKKDSTKEKGLYKSKFWDYLHPQPDHNKKKEQKKPYNSDEVKTFMQKQREQRKVEQLKKSKEKQEEQERRQRMLRELESKYHRPKGKSSSEFNLANSRSRPFDHASMSPPKRSKLDTESPSLKYLKPLLERKLEPGFLRKSEGNPETAAKQAQYLISEFEAIVKRECIGILKQIPRPPNNVEKVDKAVCTSVSMDELNSSKIPTPINSNDIPSPNQIEKAVLKIQAAYKGYRVRKALAETRIDLKKPYHKTCESSYQHNRRWSLPASGYPLPEKPFSTPGKVLPMSPIPISSFNPSAIPCYIPPPSSVTQNSKIVSRPRVLPNIALTPVRLRVYDEPYPKVNQTPSAPSVSVTPSRDQFTKSNQRASVPPNFILSRTIENLTLPQSTSEKPKSRLDLDLSVPSALPSVLDAFREKLNHFRAQLQPVAQSVDFPKASSYPSERKEPVTYTTEFETVSSSDVKSTVSASDEIVETPKIRKRRHRSRTKSVSTTVETEEDFTSSSSKMQSEEKRFEDQSNSSGSMLPPTTSNSLGRLYAPSLKLRYEAERERIKVIEKALQVQLTGSTNVTSKDASVNVPHTSSKVLESPLLSKGDSLKEKANASESVQYAIAKVQKESLRAAAEMAKWMAEFQKSTTENKNREEKVTSVDLPALVHAAVEEALRVGEEKKKGNAEKVRKRPKSGKRSSSPRSSSTKSSSDPVETSKKPTSSELSPNEIPEPRIEELRRNECRDYQQQFPSDTGGSPLHKTGKNVGEFLIERRSPGCSSLTAENLEASSLEYPSIIPSGNSVEITSLDQKVSSLANASSVSAAVTGVNGDLSWSEKLKTETEVAVPTQIETDQSDIELDDARSRGETEVEQISPGTTSEVEEETEEEKAKNQLISNQRLGAAESQSEVYSVVEEFTESFIDENEAATHSSERIEIEEKISSGSVDFVVDLVGSEENEEVAVNASFVVDLVGLEEKEVVAISTSFAEAVSEQISPTDKCDEDKQRLSEEDGDPIKTETRISDLKSDDEGSQGETEVDNLSPGVLTEEEAKNNEVASTVDKKTQERLPEVSSVIEEFAESFIEENEAETKSHESEVKDDHFSASPFELVEEVIELDVDEDSDFKSSSAEEPESAHESDGEKPKITESEEIKEVPSVSEHDDDSVIEDYDVDKQQSEEGVDTILTKPLKSEHDSSSDNYDEENQTASEEEKKVSVELSSVSVQVSVAEECDRDVKEMVSEEVGVDIKSLAESVEDLVDKKYEVENPDVFKEEDYTEPDTHLGEEKSDVEKIPEKKEVEPMSLTSADIHDEEENAQKESMQEVNPREPQSDVSSIIEEFTESFIEEKETETETKSPESRVIDKPIPPKPVELLDDLSGLEKKEEEISTKSSSPEPEQKSLVDVVDENDGEKENEELKDTSKSPTGPELDLTNHNIEEGKEESVQPTEPSPEKEVPVFTSKPQHSLLIPEAEKMPQESEIPLKPPPPYSPSSSLDSTSISSRSLMICLAKPKVERIVQEQVKKIWPLWTSLSATSGKCLPPVNQILESKQQSTEEYTLAASNDPSSIGNLESLGNAIENFDLLLWHLVYDTIKETLLGANNSSSFIERVRPGPLALQAQTMKIPRSKESLISDVLNKVLKTIPATFFRDSDPDIRKKSKKWCSRPRELVDEILLEELEKENYQWTEWWPEEKIVIHNATNNIIRGLIRNALEKRNYVYEQGWAKCLNFKGEMVSVVAHNLFTNREQT